MRAICLGTVAQHSSTQGQGKIGQKQGKHSRKVTRWEGNISVLDCTRLPKFICNAPNVHQGLAFVADLVCLCVLREDLVAFVLSLSFVLFVNGCESDQEWSMQSSCLVHASVCQIKTRCAFPVGCLAASTAAMANIALRSRRLAPFATAWRGGHVWEMCEMEICRRMEAIQTVEAEARLLLLRLHASVLKPTCQGGKKWAAFLQHMESQQELLWSSLLLLLSVPTENN